MSVCGYVHMNTCVCACQKRVLDPWSWSYRELWAVRHECWELNSGPLKEQQVLNFWTISLAPVTRSFKEHILNHSFLNIEHIHTCTCARVRAHRHTRCSTTTKVERLEIWNTQFDIKAQAAEMLLTLASFKGNSLLVQSSNTVCTFTLRAVWSPGLRNISSMTAWVESSLMRDIYSKASNVW